MTTPGLIDSRAPRTGAWITTVVLAVVLLLAPGQAAAALLALQGLVFALGVRGRSPYTVLFRRLVRPRLRRPAVLEPVQPTRFAQLVGLLFATVGTVAMLTGAPAVATAAVAAALAAAFLDAAFGLCLGCELFLLFRRGTAAANGPAPTPARDARPGVRTPSHSR